MDPTFETLFNGSSYRYSYSPSIIAYIWDSLRRPVKGFSARSIVCFHLDQITHVAEAVSDPWRREFSDYHLEEIRKSCDAIKCLIDHENIIPSWYFLLEQHLLDNEPERVLDVLLYLYETFNMRPPGILSGLSYTDLNDLRGDRAIGMMIHSALDWRFVYFENRVEIIRCLKEMVEKEEEKIGN